MRISPSCLTLRESFQSNLLKEFPLNKTRTAAALAGILLTSTLGVTTASAQEAASIKNNTVAEKSPSESLTGLLSPREIEEAKTNGSPFFEITKGTDRGFDAKVYNASIKQKGDKLSLIDKNGRESLYLNSHVLLTDGSSVKVNYKVTGSKITGTFEKPVPKNKVVISGAQERGAATCAAGVLTSIGAVAGGAAGILSAPATGPVGPLATVAASTTIAGTVGGTAAACSGRG